MIIEHPFAEQIPALRRLWKQAFGDSEAFLDCFFQTAYAPQRCRCITVDGQLAAALYWFDCDAQGQKLAYLYAVATEKAFQGQGLCRRLMANTHDLLAQAGYAGAVLVPGSEDLFKMYEKMGYRTFSYVREFACAPGAPVALTKLTCQEYLLLRRQLLPKGGVAQEGTFAEFLQTQCAFYGGEDFLLAATVNGDSLITQEFLGNAKAATGILGALGAAQGRFRTPGQEKPFAMCYPLNEQFVIPTYFGIPMD